MTENQPDRVRAARIALHAKNLDFETREVALFESAQFEPEYLKLNP